MERKKDLDTTKEKMDKLVEKLYLGRSVISQSQKFSLSRSNVQYCALKHHSKCKNLSSIVLLVQAATCERQLS